MEVHTANRYDVLFMEHEPMKLSDYAMTLYTEPPWKKIERHYTHIYTYNMKDKLNIDLIDYIIEFVYTRNSRMSYIYDLYNRGPPLSQINLINRYQKYYHDQYLKNKGNFLEYPCGCGRLTYST